MNFRRSQRSDREGSFPEPPFRMDGDSSLSASSITQKKNRTRFRRSIRALSCFSGWSKHSKSSQRLINNPVTNHVFPGAVAEDSWESACDVYDDDFEIRTTSPPHSVDGRFDVSQALHVVPEMLEEEDETESTIDQQQQQTLVEPKEVVEEVASVTSKQSDYSSEFMTDDSTETSGLPVDSSFSLSQNESSESAEADDSARIGIRPFKLPADMMIMEGAIQDSFIVEESSSPTSVFVDREQSSTDEKAHVTKEEPQTGSFDVGEDHTLNPHNDDDQDVEGDEVFIVQSTSSGAYSDEMRDVLRLFSDTSFATNTGVGTGSAAKSSSESSEGKHKLDLRRDDKPKRSLNEHNVLSKEVPKEEGPSSDTQMSSPVRKTSSKVKELMKKFGDSSEGEGGAFRRAPMSPQKRSLYGSMEPVTKEATPEFPPGVPSVIMSHSIQHTDENKGFFWRSRPQIPTSFPEEELVDTSTSTTEGNRSMDYSEVFSQEELEREYSAPGEPPFIHI